MRCVVAAGALSSLLFVVGCRTDILKDTSTDRDGFPAARVEVLEGRECPGRASVVSAPDHCAWPAGATRHSLLAEARFTIVARVGSDGRAESIRVVDAPPGFDAAATACARNIDYRPAALEDEGAASGETCAVSIRLARYASDVNPPDRPTLTCPPVFYPKATQWLAPGTCDP